MNLILERFCDARMVILGVCRRQEGNAPPYIDSPPPPVPVLSPVWTRKSATMLNSARLFRVGFSNLDTERTDGRSRRHNNLEAVSQAGCYAQAGVHTPSMASCMKLRHVFGVSCSDDEYGRVCGKTKHTPLTIAQYQSHPRWCRQSPVLE